MKIIEESGYLEKLPNNCTVMADRGFKGISTLLKNKNCELIRPPSVSAGVKMTKEEIAQTRRIASLRIHIERVIRRFREYEFLKHNSSINIKLIPYTDYVVTIVAALINLQKPIIKSNQIQSD